ncbi:zinc finger BED domain-containing protein RICESLEEPER 2-like [Tripterygium wilfordii]|uniref:zinc finger BED domain-containing protein RICESLEEPER 2-like n=1 Tax=Tripterygium wilfordii TaxID=458696 RepID=UPI0018F7FFD9|nr:zinc finger BED domain-containing protein RICESLEEPER 2-like [Tripterygium wilfordii]
MARTKRKNMGPPQPIPPPVEQVEEVDNSHSSEEKLTPSSHQTSGASSTATKPKKRKEISEAWAHYDRIVIEGQDLKAKCKHCGAKCMVDPNKHGTKNLKIHVKKCKVLLSQKSPMDNYTISHDGDTTSNEMRLHKFDSNMIRAALIEWIICEELLFRIVKSKKFKEFCKVMEPRYVVPSRMTVARHIFKTYNAQKEKLKEALKGSVGRLHKRIISFCMVEDHKGEGIEKQLEKVTKEWGIEKIMCITVDNASANEDTSLILNIIVKFGLQKCIISVERIKNAVKYVRLSPKRLSKFLECTKQVGVICTKSLCLDVATRWNSIYLMLEVTVEYEFVFDRLHDEDLGNRNSFPNDIVFQAIQDHLKNAQIDNYKVISEIAGEMMVKYDQYFGNILKVSMLVYVALVLDPRSKLDIFKRFLQLAFDEKTSDELYEGTKKLLQDLYKKYHSILGAPQSQSSVSQVSKRNDTSSSSSTSSTRVSNAWDIVCDHTECATSLSKYELDKYLVDDRETSLNDFDLLNF